MSAEQPKLAIYLLVPSLVLVSIGSALVWARTGSVTSNTTSQRVLNFDIISFFYTFLFAATLTVVRLRDANNYASFISLLWFALAGSFFYSESECFFIFGGIPTARCVAVVGIVLHVVLHVCM